MSARTIAIDWDGTLWGDGAFLPGAVDALRALKRRGWRVVVFSCRCNYSSGRDEIAAALLGSGLSWVSVWPGSGKPDVDVFVDDRALRFGGDWPAALRELRSL